MFEKQWASFRDLAFLVSRNSDIFLNSQQVKTPPISVDFPTMLDGDFSLKFESPNYPKFTTDISFFISCF